MISLHAATLLALLLRPAAALDAQSRQALWLDDCGPALADARRGENDAERLALARCLLITGKAEDARSQARAVSSGLSPYGKLLEGEALVALGRWKEASAALEGALRLPGSAGRRAAAARGQALVEAGELDAAREQLRALLSGDFAGDAFLPPPGDADPGAVRYWLAEGAVRRGDKDSAIPVWERIWTANPTSPAATLAAKRLADAGRPVPDPSSEAGQALIRARMKSFERLRMFPEALAMRDRLPSAPVSAPKGLAAEAQAAFDAKDYPRAVSLFAKLPSPSAQQRFNHALATSRAGDYPGAAALYTRLYQAEPGAALADQASFKIGYLSYDAGDLGQAVPLLQAHLRRYPSSRYADEARWFIGWSLYRLGKKADASAAFSDLISKDPKSELAIGAVYWRARIADQGGDSASAKKGYETVLRSWPLSGYAWFASRRLGQSAEVAARSPNPPVPATLAALPGFAEGRALAAVGLHSWARDRLLPLVATARSASAESQNALAAALIEAGAYRAGQDLVRARCPRPGAGDPTLQQLCWPEPMGAAVHGAATRYGLPAGLPFAIMTAESALDPEVTSMAGARGLMQLMPALAAQHAPEVYPGRPWNPDNLYDPGINARLGVHELGGLWASFQSRSVQPALPMVIAGYNAGSAAVERWLGEAAPGTEADEWAENIGYTETRRYVRRVLGYLRAYELIYGG